MNRASRILEFSQAFQKLEDRERVCGRLARRKDAGLAAFVLGTSFVMTFAVQYGDAPELASGPASPRGTFAGVGELHPLLRDSLIGLAQMVPLQ